MSTYETEAPVCGEAYDHNSVITWQDAHEILWRCERCGAEGWDER